MGDKQNIEPMGLERKFKLQFFAITSVHKDLKQVIESDKKKIVLSTVVAYSSSEAVIASRQVLRTLGADPDDYIIPSSILSTEIQKLVKVSKNNAITPRLTVPGVKEITKQKSIQDMFSYIRLVFDTVGTKAEKKVAEKVIKKFKKNKNV